MLLEKISEVERSCTGCALCASVCPAGAVTMRPDSKGFFIPTIDSGKCTDCGKCEKKCPQLNIVKNNSNDPACYAVKADDNTLSVSSSGGAFSILTEYVFRKGGYVCGAAYDEDFMGVSHIMISDRSDMYKLRGSKYVYSKPGDIYKQVKEKLDAGNYVLFSGTPCQIAALNGFLVKEYDKLITVDILCHGVPTDMVFKKYISEIAQGREIASVSFRPKEFGWQYSGILVKFVDGSEHIVHSVRDPYLMGFLNRLYIRESCNNCPFATLPRQGDFTIGDFWHIEKYDESIDTTDGVSCVLLNTHKAGTIFSIVKKDIAFMKKIPLSFLLTHNMFVEKRRPHLARTRFYSLLDKGFSFKKAVEYSLGWKFDIALTGCWTVHNYGGELTYYAFYKKLQEMGYTVIMVERRADIPDYNVPVPSLFGKNPYPFFDVCRIHKSFADQRELNQRVKTFILGSDQVWNYSLMAENDVNSYTLDYVEPYRKKIAYSSSFGGEKFIGSETQRNTLKKHLSSFSHISVREKSGINICREMGVKAEWVIDPVFLCDKEELNKLALNSVCEANGNYLFYYFIDPSEGKHGIDDLCRKLDVNYIGTINADKKLLKFFGFSSETFPYKYEENCKLEDWLKYLINSSYVVTDSFHAVCLCIIYHIPFVFIKDRKTDKNGLGRVTNILGEFGLLFAIADTVTDALKKNLLRSEFNWDDIDHRLEREKMRSEEWLRKAIDSDII